MKRGLGQDRARHAERRADQDRRTTFGKKVHQRRRGVSIRDARGCIYPARESEAFPRTSRVNTGTRWADDRQTFVRYWGPKTPARQDEEIVGMESMISTRRIHEGVEFSAKKIRHTTQGDANP